MSKPWHAVPSNQLLVATRTYDRVALPIEAIPLQHFERLADLSKAGSPSAQLRPEACRAYSYAWRNFLCALARSSPELLRLSPEKAFSDGLDTYCSDLRERKMTQRAASYELNMLASAAAAIVPSYNREMMREYKQKLASFTWGK